MIRVLSAGVGRSGSTWLHNAILALLKQRYNAPYGDWVDRWDPLQAARADALVLKVHGVSQIGSFKPDIVATCHRDLRDVALSLRDYQKLNSDEDILSGVAWARGCHEEFAPRAHIDMAYEQMVIEPLSALADLARVLNILEPDCARARITVEAWEPLPGGRKHRFDGRPGRWREQLGTHLCHAIECKHGDWLNRLGYPPSTIDDCVSGTRES